MRGDISRGDIWWAEWSPGRGSEETGRRPSLVVQSNVANCGQDCPSVIMLAISSSGRNLPWHVRVVPAPENGLTAISYVKCEQIVSIDEAGLDHRIGRLSADDMRRVEAGLRRVLDL